MKKILFAMVLAVAFVACNHNEPTETKKDGTDTIPPHQPTDSTWSPVGHIYVYETTSDISSDPDKFWAWVLDFTVSPFAAWYQTDKRDFSYNGCVGREDATYKLNYPDLVLNIDFGRNLKFIDTTTIDASIWGFNYTIFK